MRIQGQLIKIQIQMLRRITLFFISMKYKSNIYILLNNFFQKMGLKDLIQNSIWRMDLLSAPPTFRTRQQPVYQTCFGGVLSIIILGVFYYFLYLQMSDMLGKLKISYNQGVDDNIHATSSVTSVPFAVSIEGVDLSVTPRKFMFELWQNHIDRGNASRSRLNLSPCNLSDWTGYGSNFEHQFMAFGFGQMLCVTNGQTLSLAGYAGSDIYQYLTLNIYGCNSTVDPNCDTTANINSFMTAHLNVNDYFKVKFFVLDTIVTPNNHDAISYVLEKNIFLAFSSTMGTVGYLNVAEFDLQTDQSLLPISDFDSTKGVYIQGHSTSAVSLSTTRFINFNIFRSTKSLTIQRTIGKLDVVLSYVGGLFSLLFTGIAFFFGSYSQYKYELYVAESTLSNNHGKSFKSEDFGFITFVTYACYDWMATFGIAPDCLKKLKNIHEIREESCDQLDPSILLRRIKHLEDMGKVLMSQHNEMSLYLTQPLTLNQAKQMRGTLSYYNQLVNQIKDSSSNQVQDQILSGKWFASGKNAVRNQSVLSKKSVNEEPEELSEEEQKKLFDAKICSAVEELEKDEGEVARKIKEQVTSKVMEYIKSLKIQARLNDKELEVVNYRQNIEIVSMDEESAQEIHKVQVKLNYPKKH